jgi:hypothetical protein
MSRCPATRPEARYAPQGTGTITPATSAVAALDVARAKGAHALEVEFPDGDTFAPVRIRVTVRDPAAADVRGHHHEARLRARA